MHRKRMAKDNSTLGFITIPQVLFVLFVHRSFMLFIAASTVASRLDVTGICHSGRHAETRQHPTHQHDVCRKKRNEPQPVKHELHFSPWRSMIGNPTIGHVIDAIKAFNHSFIVRDHDDCSSLRASQGVGRRAATGFGPCRNQRSIGDSSR
jgi:hypothetical protein